MLVSKTHSGHIYDKYKRLKPITLVFKVLVITYLIYFHILRMAHVLVIFFRPRAVQLHSHISPTVPFSHCCHRVSHILLAKECGSGGKNPLL